jgi:hypothetical protein
VKEDQPKKEFPFFIFVSIYLSRVGYLRAIVLHTVNLSPSAAYSGGGSSSSTYLLPQRDLLDASWQPSHSFTVWSCRAWPFFFPSPFFFPFVKKKRTVEKMESNGAAPLPLCLCENESGHSSKKTTQNPQKNISQQDGLGTHTDTQHSFFLNLNTTYCLSRHSTSAKLQHYHHRVPFLLRFSSWMVSFLLVFSVAI